MPCGCKKKSQATSWVYVTADGQSRTYATEVEAKAARIRAGNTGEVRPA